MSSAPISFRVGVSQRGFTLLEVLITVMVIAILAAVAYPSFLDSVRKGRRADAMSAVADVQQAQERWRTNNPAFADNSLLTTAPPAGLGRSATSASGYYSIAIAAGADATSYQVTATAVSGKSQASDTNCTVMAVQATAGNIRYGGGAGSADWADPNRCWAR